MRWKRKQQAEEPDADLIRVVANAREARKLADAHAALVARGDPEAAEMLMPRLRQLEAENKAIAQRARERAGM